MRLSTQRVGLICVAFLFAFVWHVSLADPFIPVGSDPSGSNDEAALHGLSSGFAWRTPSLLYIYLVIPNASHPDNETLWETHKAIFFPPVDRISKLTIPLCTSFPSFHFPPPFARP